MSITDELREWAESDALRAGMSLRAARDQALAIADRIDEQHEKECDKAYNEGVNDGIDADKNAMGYIKLPVDANGVPIRVGDVMENVVLSDIHREVTGIGAECFYAWEDSCSRYSQFDANCYRHIQPDSWERIIKDARESSGFRTIGGELPKYTDAELVERCKRLAGE